MKTVTVRAAGGVVLRRATDGAIEVLLVHRPRYDDWSHPKGKRDPGETDEQCAVREVEEETGLRCALGEELPTTSHIDHKGRRKIVRYWLMRVRSGKAGPRNEVDAIRWLPTASAARVLTYPRDRVLLEALTAPVA